MISISALLFAFLAIIVGGLIFYVASWGLEKLALPEPFNKVVAVLLVLLAVVFLVMVLMSAISGRPLFSP